MTSLKNNEKGFIVESGEPDPDPIKEEKRSHSELKDNKNPLLPVHYQSAPVALILDEHNKSSKTNFNMDSYGETERKPVLESHQLLSTSNMILEQENKPAPNLHESETPIGEKEEAVNATADCIVSNATEDFESRELKRKEKTREKMHSRRKQSDLDLAGKRPADLDLSESLDTKCKKAHINYKKKEKREDITKKFFAFDWFADSLSRYSAGINCYKCRVKFYA